MRIFRDVCCFDRVLAEDREQNINDCQKRLLGAEDELQSMALRSRDLENRLTSSDKQCIELRHEVSVTCVSSFIR